MPRKTNVNGLAALITYNIEKELNKLISDKKVLTKKLLIKKAQNIIRNMSLDDLKKKGITKDIIKNIHGEEKTDKTNLSHSMDGSGIRDIYERTKQAVKGMAKLAKSTIDTERKKSVRYYRGNRDIIQLENKITVLQNDLVSLRRRRALLERDTYRDANANDADRRVNEIIDIEAQINKKENEMKTLLNHQFEALRIVNPPNENNDQLPNEEQPSLFTEVVQIAQLVVHLLQQPQQQQQHPYFAPPPLQQPYFAPPPPLQQPYFALPPPPPSQQQQQQPQQQPVTQDQINQMMNRLNPYVQQ